MAWHVIDSRRKIMRIIDQLISQHTTIKIRVGAEKKIFNSKFIEIIPGAISSRTQRRDELIIDKLIPDRGNSLIQSFPEIRIEFLFKNNLCRCRSSYKGISNTGPYFGFVLSFPESIEIQEKRREDRFTFEMPEFVSVEFSVKRGLQQGKVYTLNGLDCSRHGVGLLVTQKDFDLLRILGPGDNLEDITFYPTWATIRPDRIVRHKTRIGEGEYKGCYILGIESRDLIESCKRDNP